MGPLTYLLWAILGLFAAGDAAAHFTNYRFGETVSASIWALEKRLPFARVIVALVLAVLFTHLELHFP